MIRRSWITRQIIGQSPNQMTPSRALNSLYPRGVSHLFRAFTRRIEASRLPFLLSNPKEPAAHERKAGQLVTRLFRTLPVPSDRAGNPACLGWIRYRSRYPVTVTRSWLAWLIDSSGSARWFGYSVSNQQGAGNRAIPNDPACQTVWLAGSEGTDTRALLRIRRVTANPLAGVLQN